MAYVVWWIDREDHIRTAVYLVKENATNRVKELIGKYDRCGINTCEINVEK